MAPKSIPQKQCSKKEQCIHPEAICGWLPATTDYFMLHKGKLYCQCHYCRRAAKRQSHVRNAEHNNARTKRWYDANREHELEKRRQQNALNPQPNRDRVKKWKREHPDKVHKNQARYAKAHPDKVRLNRRLHQHRLRHAPGNVMPEDIALQIKAQTDKKGRLHCWWCGKTIIADFQIDHRIPVVKGGANSPDNIVIAHTSCNQSKGAKLPQEWNGRLL